MDATMLSHTQRERIRLRLTRHHDYLTKLVARMTALEWQADDPMHKAAAEAHKVTENAIAALLDADCKRAPFLRSYGKG